MPTLRPLRLCALAAAMIARQIGRKRPFDRAHHQPAGEQRAEPGGEAESTEQNEKITMNDEQERLPAADRVRPAADQVGAERPGQRQARA
jgi:hypothetical protein